MKICCVVTIPKSSLLPSLYNKGPGYKKNSDLSVTGENELLFPVPTPKAIFKQNNLHHSAVVVASIFVYPQLIVSIIET